MAIVNADLGVSSASAINTSVAPGGVSVGGISSIVNASGIDFAVTPGSVAVVNGIASLNSSSIDLSVGSSPVGVVADVGQANAAGIDSTVFYIRYAIGSVEIPTIQSISVSKGKDVSELDLVGYNSNVLLRQYDSALKMEIQASLIEKVHSTNLSVEEQRKNVKSLVSNGVYINDMDILGFNGYLSVDNVDVSESASLDTYREVTISGIFLPWPKYTK